MKFITKPCRMCKRTSELEVPDDGYRRWRHGEFIQDALPDMTADERELLVTGTHPHCWNKMFPPNIDDEGQPVCDGSRCTTTVREVNDRESRETVIHDPDCSISRFMGQS